MPRRVVTKCTRRAGGGKIDITEEMCLTSGHAFGVVEWEKPLWSRREFNRLWTAWGELLTARWAEAFPGSRPIGSYLAGEIVPPEWAHELPPLRHHVRFDGTIVIADRAWHGTDLEVDHLADLGVIDQAEYDLAVERLGSERPFDHLRYRSLADGNA